jgi:hypothetical protein
MGKLVDLVKRSTTLLLGSSVARAPRLRVKASPEAWLVTRVRTAKGGGHPTVYGLRYHLSLPDGALSFEGTEDREISGPLKGDWQQLPHSPASVRTVRSPVCLSLHPEQRSQALQQQPPFEHLRPALQSSAAREHGVALQAVEAAAAQAAAAAAAAAASAAGAEAKAS